MAKKKNQKKPKKSVAEQLSKYKDSFPKLVKFLIIEGGAINRLGNPNWGFVAGVLGVTNKTILEWRKQSGKRYHEEFAKACQEGIDAADAGQVKRGLLNVAKPHIAREMKLELQTVGPKPPPQTWTKADLIEWADRKLDLEIDPAMSKPEVIAAIVNECEEQTEKKMVVVEEKRKRMVDVGAAKIVLPNIGPKNERWLSKEAIVVEDGDFAAAFAKAMAAPPVDEPPKASEGKD